ncbi:MAG TPA: C1 family peptidase [Opitutaceae bacterium]|nr:C1 family peptidase [Opitutaceae bacterium]
MHVFKAASLSLLLGLAMGSHVLTAGAATRPGKGTHFETLVVGKKSFANVTVRDVTVRSITFSHTEGIASVALKDLPPELQKIFGYDPLAEAQADDKLEKAREANEARRAAQKAQLESRAKISPQEKFGDLLRSFGRPCAPQLEVDLRPRFRALTLGIKDQGLRPSCAIFAVVSALEYENAELIGKPEKLSEEYLLWATNKTVKAAEHGTDTASAADDAADEKDAGFSLGEVVATLRGFGIPLQSVMPNTFGKSMDAIPAPSDEVIEQARTRRKVSIYSIPGREQKQRIANFIHALDAGVPVVIGLRWPHARTLRSGYLSEQQAMPDYRHAVTIVGYRCENGELEKTVFLFRNSYGVNWGEAGYGRATFAYLSENLLDAVVLEVRENQ